MTQLVLITGGAGFIGSHVADELVTAGYSVRALDNLAEQVHGQDSARPPYLNPAVELVVGDLRTTEVVRDALAGVDAVLHLASAVGVGQSMYEVTRYMSVNSLGTSVLFEVLVDRPVRRLVVASSMSVYGEGLYRTHAGGAFENATRNLAALRRGEWEPVDDDGQDLIPVPTPEWKRPALESVYALSKFDQERLCLVLGRAYGISTVALRLFNVYGPRQALSNPYTGVLAIFASRLLNGRSPSVFEDGLQRRDFVSVADVARAFRLALESDADGEVLNIGSGESCTVRQVAEVLAGALGREFIEPEISGRHRIGDIRHCFADIAHARTVLGYEPKVGFRDGVTELAGWLASQSAVDRVDQATAELVERGLKV